MFYSWNCSLTGSGARLAGRCILDRLQSFRGAQLASFGYTGIPLMLAAVMEGRDRYTGLIIRETRKQYGSCRQIEGPADKSKPVVVIDESPSSGTSLRKAIAALEEDGFEVEGAIALVNFPFRGGIEWAQALGYRVETLFDAWDDLGAPKPHFVPGHKRLGAEVWSGERLANDLNPATAARRVAEHYLQTGKMLRPPESFDRPIDGRGGVYVSFRERASDHRLTRDGFWHFEPADADPCRDLILATVKTLRTPPGIVTLENLAGLKIGASFFGPMEPISPAKLDFSRYGIVAQGMGFETKLGGALPNSQVFTCEIEQYRHARWRNARIAPHEPHTLYRHEITKCLEPGEYWLPYGTYHDPAIHWAHSDALGRVLTARAWNAVEAAWIGQSLSPTAIPASLIDCPVYAVAVTLYRKGVIGCFLAWSGSLDSCIVRAATKAVADVRFTDKRKSGTLEDLSLTVSLLHDREWLGDTTLEKAAMKLRLGADTMSAQQGERRGFLLASVAPHFNWGKEQFAKEVLRKAGITRAPYTWATYQTATWLRSGRLVRKIASGYPERGKTANATADLAANTTRLANYILRKRTGSGLPEYTYLPQQDNA